jgi:DNA polymerase-1
MLAHYLIEPESAHDLPVLCSQFLSYDLFADIDSKQKNQVCERVDLIFQLRDKLQGELESRGHATLMSDVEMPLVSVLAAMEYEGVRVDVDAL